MARGYWLSISWPNGRTLSNSNIVIAFGRAFSPNSIQFTYREFIVNIVFITIGRNIGADSAMSFDTWEEFKSRVTLAIRHEVEDVCRATGLVIEVHEGIGSYDGVREESAIISARWEDNGEPLQVNYLRGHLRFLAEKYGQESIALSIGTSDLVFA